MATQSQYDCRTFSYYGAFYLNERSTAFLKNTWCTLIDYTQWDVITFYELFYNIECIQCIGFIIFIWKLYLNIRSTMHLGRFCIDILFFFFFVCAPLSQKPQIDDEVCVTPAHNFPSNRINFLVHFTLTWMILCWRNGDSKSHIITQFAAPDVGVSFARSN